MVSYNRRMGNSVPQVIDYASPWINLAMTIEDRKRAKEDYGLKRQWEEEDRALRQKQIDENKALSAEERAYQRSRDAKQDMLAQEQRDYAAEDRLWDQKKYEDDLGFKKSDEARKAELHNIEMKIAKDMGVVNQRKSEMKGLNPEAERILGQVQETYKSLLSAVNEGNEKAIEWHTDKISELNTQYKQLTSSGGVTPTPNPIVPNPDRDAIRASMAQNGGTGVQAGARIIAERSGNPIPKPSGSPAVEDLRQLVQSGNKAPQGETAVPINNGISESEIEFAMRQFKTDRPTAILMIQKQKEALNAVKDYGLRGIKKAGNIINAGGNVLGRGIEYLDEINSEVY
jgi:hypothetical protein